MEKKKNWIFFSLFVFLFLFPEKKSCIFGEQTKNRTTVFFDTKAHKEAFLLFSFLLQRSFFFVSVDNYNYNKSSALQKEKKNGVFFSLCLSFYFCFPYFRRIKKKRTTVFLIRKLSKKLFFFFVFALTELFFCFCK